jgi:hypothetical protein
MSRQVTIGGMRVYDLPSDAIAGLGGSQGGVKDAYGRIVSYSTIFRNVMSLDHARAIIAEVNRLLVANGEDAMTVFLYDHCQYTV